MKTIVKRKSIITAFLLNYFFVNAQNTLKHNNTGMVNLNLEIQHVEVHVSSVEQAKEFYISKLGLEFLEETPAANLFSVKAGSVRISVFGGYQKNENSEGNEISTHIIFKTDNIETTVDELKKRGVNFTSDIVVAPGFIKCISTKDPDGNTIEIGEYLRDPLKKVR